MNSAMLKELAAGVRRVWSPPAGRAWSNGDLAILKLLKAVEEHVCADAVDDKAFLGWLERTKGKP